MSDGWAKGFEERARAFWTDREEQKVTEGKDLPILPSTAPTLLRALGLLHRDASMPPRQVRKFLQLNHMLRLLRPPLVELMESKQTLSIIDAGCGLSYLTLSLAWCFENVYRHPVSILGIDREADRVQKCQAMTDQVGLSRSLSFRADSIEDFSVEEASLDGVLALHACDTATDDAIALGLRHHADLIAIAPCCQAELARSWALANGTLSPEDPLRALKTAPHLRREAAATITDTLRMLLLRTAGYETRVVEFVSSRHTPKNTLIRAIRRHEPDPSIAKEYQRMRIATGAPALKLERMLPREVAELVRE